MAGGSKQVRNQPKPDTESKTKGKSPAAKSETEVESKPQDDPNSASSITNADVKGKGKKHMSPKQKSPMKAGKGGKSKGIVIEEPKEPEPGNVEKSGVKRKREFAVTSSYSLRSGLKGTVTVDVGQPKVARKSTVRKVKGKKKEKESDEVEKVEEVDEEGSSCKRQSKRLKRNDDKDKDDEGGSQRKTTRSLRARASKA